MNDISNTPSEVSSRRKPLLGSQRSICESMASGDHRGDDTIINFSNLEFKVNSGKDEKIILKQICGHYTSGELIALMGPSGAGKTSLMSILCGQNDQFTGEFTLNGQPWNSDMNNFVGFAAQHELFFPDQSVEDTLFFRARMRLPRDVSDDTILERITSIIKDLKIEHTRNVKIGGWSKNLSGGELKKVAVGMELLTNPRVLILDEPTSGLDSTSAYELVSTLKRIAIERNIIVIISLHQPSMKLFAKFDRATFMRDGHIVYHGSAGVTLNRYADSLGFPCGVGVGITDHLLELLGDDEKLDIMLDKYQRSLRYNGRLGYHLDLEADEAFEWPQGYPRVAVENVIQEGAESESSHFTMSTVSKRTKLYLLFMRCIKAEFDRCYQFADLLELAFQIIVQALIYWNVYANDRPVDFNSHIGQIFGLTVSLTFKGLFTTLFGELMFRYPVRREVVSRIYTHGEYKFVHWVAQTLVYLPWPTAIFATCAIVSGVPKTNGAFRGAWLGFVSANLLGQAIGAVLNVFLPHFGAAANVGVAFQLIALLVSGNFTTPESIPKFISWLTYLSHIFYSSAISINSMIGVSGMNYSYPCTTSDDGICTISGSDMIQGYGISLNLWQSFLCSFGLYVAFQLVSYFGFKYGKYYK